MGAVKTGLYRLHKFIAKTPMYQIEEVLKPLGWTRSGEKFSHSYRQGGEHYEALLRVHRIGVPSRLDFSGPVDLWEEVADALGFRFTQTHLKKAMEETASVLGLPEKALQKYIEAVCLKLKEQRMNSHESISE